MTYVIIPPTQLNTVQGCLLEVPAGALKKVRFLMSGTTQLWHGSWPSICYNWLFL